MSIHRATDAATVRRRWLMPLVILCVAGAIAVWASAREAAKIQEVEAAMRSLCRDVAAGLDGSAYFDPASDLLRERTAKLLRSTCPAPEMANVVDVVVRPGDLADAGQLQGRATHTATLSSGGVELLTLRVRYLGSDRIYVVGYSVAAAVGRNP